MIQIFGNIEWITEFWLQDILIYVQDIHSAI